MTGAAVESSFRLFRRIFPLRPLDPSEAPLSEEERRVYRRWEVAGLLPFALFVPALGYPWFLALKWGAQCFPQEIPGTLLLLRLDPMIWVVPAGFLGLVTSAIPMNALYYALLGRRNRRFNRFCDERVGFDGKRAFALLAVIVIAGVLASFSLAVLSFARFTETGVEIGRAIPPGRTSYEYAQVRSVEHRLTFQAPNGRTIHKTHYAIVFDDGSAWLSNGVHNPPPDVAERIARLVAQRSGRPIIERP
jgi:hypothetical protein